jgi:hypothetical protein
MKLKPIRIPLLNAGEWIREHAFGTASFFVGIATIAVFAAMTAGGDTLEVAASGSAPDSVRNAATPDIEPAVLRESPQPLAQGVGQRDVAEERAGLNDDTVPALETVLRSQVSVSVEKDTATHFAGSIRKGDRVIGRFEVAESDGRTASVVKLGDESFEMAADANTGEFTGDGHNMVITEERLADVKAALDVMDRELIPQTGADLDAAQMGLLRKKGRLRGQVAWLASTHPGFVVGQYSSSISPNEQTDAQAPYGYGQDGVKCVNSYKGKNLRAYIRYYNSPSWPGNGSVGYTYKDYPVGSPCSGRCGNGCSQPSYADGHFMDCHEHDVCTGLWGNSNDVRIANYWRCEANAGYAADDFFYAAWHSCSYPW